ncbi:MAG: hypothetical protein N4A38_01575 [Candidatus Gracilibacteria bacterium]|nr:hypothetical protein [Candidatus Gracilibacteria bacterium]
MERLEKNNKKDGETSPKTFEEQKTEIRKIIEKPEKIGEKYQKAEDDLLKKFYPDIYNTYFK